MQPPKMAGRLWWLVCPGRGSLVPGPGLSRGYRRPGAPVHKPPPWKWLSWDWRKGLESVGRHWSLLQEEALGRLRGPEGRSLRLELQEQSRLLWQAQGPDSLKHWRVSSDQEIGGRSRARLSVGGNGRTALLTGELSTEPPRDGETRYSGYCSLRSRPLKGAFDLKKYYDLSNFNTLHLRVRGDGRPWMVNISSEMYFTHQKDDLYNYFLFTQGGPYWQDVKIPFSKFFLSSRGRIQDNQHPLWLDKINTIGFTLGDKVDGPFQLEIDFIAVCNDRAHTEEFAYEKYKRNPEV
ncbi:complex I intermediate-associated protein 30, mitochondrial [Carcharodon carcharias]|uniref:complex I intermediate-associated protein 30, mitochondrial n=1 Tax=Carcharodon carcharias TaxID=13397 RepID=UPI001B7EAC8A|nr:complex I intermediate-associated protein 30, mitochondrial [Carcharodon carcharias]